MALPSIAGNVAKNNSSLRGYGAKRNFRGVEVVSKFEYNGNTYVSCIYPREKVVTNTIYEEVSNNGLITDTTIEDRLGGGKEFLGK